jgi:BirA family transcriptional regulator, biotin operon repressor / biotin---[acetyl-CoA-carboxylase] ligase
MKSDLLNILRNQDEFISGEALSTRLGISRVAIWKHLQKLQACGYEIQSGPKGYRLDHSPDTPYPWEFPQRESRIHYFDRLESTMNTTRQLARKGCPEFTVVIAAIQTHGRGRMDRTWVSQDGGLYFTLVLRPAIPPVLSPRVNFAVSLLLARTLRDICGVDARVKWPNDILVDGLKICGMLSEMEAAEDQVAFINVGIGINLNNEPPPDLPTATSIKALCGKRFSRKAFLAAFLDRLETRIHQQDLSHVIEEWKSCSATLGQQVRIVSRHDITEGRAVDVDPNGALIVETADGTLKTIYYGDCFHGSPQKLDTQN